MGIYKYIRESWNSSDAAIKDLWRQRLIKWRAEEVTVRLEHPTRLDRARSVGYRAKPGFIVVRQRVDRGGHMRPLIRAGRKPKNFRKYLALRKNYQLIAEERVQKKYPNLVVLNSYWLAQDGTHKWFEIILVDPEHPAIKSDKNISWICSKSNFARVYHGKTMAGKQTRGLTGRGQGYEKARPSRRAHRRRQ